MKINVQSSVETAKSLLEAAKSVLTAASFSSDLFSAQASACLQKNAAFSARVSFARRRRRNERQRTEHPCTRGDVLPLAIGVRIALQRPILRSGQGLGQSRVVRRGVPAARLRERLQRQGGNYV
jgi:hypothetical protein